MFATKTSSEQAHEIFYETQMIRETLEKKKKISLWIYYHHNEKKYTAIL